MLLGKKHIHKNAGFTLVELLVAFALMMIVLVPITGMFIMSARATALSRELTIASVTAQLRMEELVGMSKDEMCVKLQLDDPIAVVTYDPDRMEDYDDTKSRVLEIKSSVGDYNGFRVDTTAKFDYTDDSGEYPKLALVTVEALNKNGKMLCEQTNIINVHIYEVAP